MTPYERVRQSRELTAATFPLPSVLDCIRYAITELAEYDDALLRQERTGDKRNNDKTHDPRSELGQALYMLLSAYIQWNDAPDLTYFDFKPDEQWVEDSLYFSAVGDMAKLADDVYSRVSPIVPVHERSKLDNMLSQADEAYNDIYALVIRHSWDFDALIDDTCAAFEAKHAPAREAR